MSARRSLIVAAFVLGMTVQGPISRSGAETPTKPVWHPAGRSAMADSGGSAMADSGGTAISRTAATSLEPVPAEQSPPSRPTTPVVGSSEPLPSDGTLPNGHGQIWREYDISPYTLNVTSTKRPEQAVIDWILQETGYEAWHGEPLGVLSASPRTLRVYHTPEIQAVVADLVDRFVSSEAESTAFSLRVATVEHPNWRAKAQRMLRPVSVQTPGASAWLLAKEDAAMLLSDLGRRSDFRQHSSPYMMVNNGQSTVVSSTRERDYIRDLLPQPNAWPSFQAEMGQIDEGFTLEFGPLLSADRRMIDAVIKCDIDQVEKMVPVVIEVPTAVAPRQRTNIEVPQITHFRFHERFRWPTDQVLLIDMGMVAMPVPIDSKPWIPGLPMGAAPTRADLLVFVEAKGRSDTPAGLPMTARHSATSYRAR